MNYASRIRGLRNRLGLNQAQFAERMRVSQATVSRWEAGTQVPSAEALASIQLLGRLDDEDLIDDVKQLFGEDGKGRQVELVGSVQERKLVDSPKLPSEKREILYIPDIHAWKDYDIEAYTILSERKIASYGQGSVVFTIPFQEGSVEPKDGDLVVFADIQPRTLRYEVFMGVFNERADSFNVGSLRVDRSLEEEVEYFGGFQQAGFMGLVVGGIAIEDTTKISPRTKPDTEGE